MSNFVITSDLSSNLNEHFLKKYNVSRIAFPLFLDDEPYLDLNYHDFYHKMRVDSAIPSTSLINPEEATKFLESFLSEGLDVIHLTISSKLSGTFGVFKQVANTLKDKYKNQKITIVDSMSVAGGQGLLHVGALQMQQNGSSYNEVVSWLEQQWPNAVHLFTVESLFYLQRGGRIPKTMAIVGTALGIRPLMCLGETREIVLKSKVRGRNASIEGLAKWVGEIYGKDKNPFMFVAHADCPDDAKHLADLVTDKYKCDVYISEITPVIGAHCGPGTLHIAFWGASKP